MVPSMRLSATLSWGCALPEGRGGRARTPCSRRRRIARNIYCEIQNSCYGDRHEGSKRNHKCTFAATTARSSRRASRRKFGENEQSVRRCHKVLKFLKTTKTMFGNAWVFAPEKFGRAWTFCRMNFGNVWVSGPGPSGHAESASPATGRPEEVSPLARLTPPSAAASRAGRREGIAPARGRGGPRPRRRGAASRGRAAWRGLAGRDRPSRRGRSRRPARAR